jgi:hypothetical protein
MIVDKVTQKELLGGDKIRLRIPQGGLALVLLGSGGVSH